MDLPPNPTPVRGKIVRSYTGKAPLDPNPIILAAPPANYDFYTPDPSSWAPEPSNSVSQAPDFPHVQPSLRATVRTAADILEILPASSLRAEFGTRDFAYDWVLNYLEHHRVWNESSSFKVVARNPATRPNASSALGKTDGHPDAIHEPAPLTGSWFRWRGYYISVHKSVAGYAHYDTGEEVGGTLSISIWRRNRQILDDFVRAARQFYINNKRSTNALRDTMTFTISTKQSDLGWGNGHKDTVRYMPAHDTKQRFLFTSERSGRGTWVQVVVTVRPAQLELADPGWGVD